MINSSKESQGNNTNTFLTEIFVVIKCGYEGIEGLIYATNDASDAVNKVKTLRQEILKAKERMNKILAEHGNEEDENYDNYYDKMLKNKEIEWDEYVKAKYENINAYCVQKWDGKKFSCVCNELGCEPSETWLF